MKPLSDDKEKRSKQNVALISRLRLDAQLTPLLMGLYSLITLIGVEMNKARSLVVAETTSWYDKKGELTFIDILAVVRRSIWSKRFSKSANHHDLVKIIDQDMNFILDQLAIAAYLIYFKSS